MNFNDTQLISFLVATLLLTLSPGADTMLVIRNVIRGGKKDGVITTLGICTGLFVHATLSACGISMILVKSAMLFNIVKTIGAFYLIYLGTKSIYFAIKFKEENQKEDINISKEKESFLKSFREGILSNVLNPKTAVFYMAFLPQFINPGDPVFLKSLFLTGIHFIMGLIWLVSLSLFLNQIKNVLDNSFVKRALESLTGTILIGFGIKLGLEKN